MTHVSTDIWLNKQYHLGPKLGAGGMGIVYQATDRLNGTNVALKRLLLRNTPNVDPEQDKVRIGLAREFRTLASLRHPNIISVLDYGFDAERQPYYTMQLLDGAQTLSSAAQGKSPLEKIGLILQVLQALTYLHRRRIVHRDLKPSNVMVIDGQVKVLDFGLAVFADQSSEDDTAGSLAYIAPEVLQGAAATPASDLYAVGVMLYELLVGRHPFITQDTSRLLEQIIYKDPDLTPIEAISTTLSASSAPVVTDSSATTSSNPLDSSKTVLLYSTFNQGIAPSSEGEPDSVNLLVSILQRLLTKNRDRRFQDASTVIAELTRAANLPAPPETPEVRESYLQAARFVGRNHELDQLADAARNLVRNRLGAAILIGGESGIGKTRLLEEWRSLALVEGARVLRSEEVGEGSAPYHLWLPLFHSLVTLIEFTDEEASVFKPYVPALAALLERDIADAPPLEPQQAQLRLCRCVSAALSRVTQPTVLMLENLHWISSESLELLKSLIPVTAAAPLLIVGSYRSDEHADLETQLSGFMRIQLERLNEHNLSELSVSMLGEVGKQPAILDLLKRETEGNAFFLVEIIRALAEERGRLDAISSDSLPAQVFPGGVRALIQRRIASIPTDWQATLRLVAVMGRQLDIPALQNQLGDALDGWLAYCSDAALLNSPDGKWQFAHDKIRTYLLETLPSAERIALHRDAALILEATYPQAFPLAALAHHWGQAGNTDKELFYAEATGFQCLTNNANVEARRYFERAIELLRAENGSPEHEIRLRFGLNTALVSAFGFGMPEVAANMRESLRLSEILQKPETIFTLLRAFNMHYLFLGDMNAASALCDRLFIFAAQSDNPDFLMEATHMLGIALFHKGHFDQAQEHLLKAWKMVTPDKFSDQIMGYGVDSTVSIGFYLCLAYVHIGENEEGRKIAQAMIDLARRNGHPFSVVGALVSIALMHILLGEPEAAAPLAQEVLASAIAHVLPHWQAWGLGLVGYTKGDADGIQLMEQGIALHRAIGSWVSNPTEHGLFAATLLRLGRVSEAEQAVESGLADIARRGEGWWQAELYRLRGQVLEAKGDLEGAAAAYRLAIATGQAQKARNFEVQAQANLAAILNKEASVAS